MKARILTFVAVAMMAFSMLPAHADDPLDPRAQHVLNAVNRIPPGAPGETRHVTLLYGPFSVPPGHDRNLVTVDVPIQTGFYTSVFPNLVDVRTGKEPTEQEAHIHHAHWFRVSKDPQYEQYNAISGVDGLSWVFGTGEERTGGTLTDRQSTQEGWKYGIFLDGSTPQLLIFMIHNKTQGALNAYITLDIDMIYGNAQQIKEATGQEMHPLRGVLTGTTQDARTNLNVLRSKNGVLTQDYTADFKGTLIASASHMHPGGKWVYVVNLGGNKVCESADPDKDGIPGTTLFVSNKIDQVQAAWPYSEDYQMGGTQGGFRAPIHQGDVIRQYGVYDMPRSGEGAMPEALFRSDPLDATSKPDYSALDGKPHAWYAAMSYTGLYSDTLNASFPLADGVTNVSDCTLANFAPRIQPGVPTGEGHFQFTTDPRQTFATHPWLHYDAVCGMNDPNRGDKYFACDSPNPIQFHDGLQVDTIHVASFVYLPGDLSMRNLDGSMNVPLVKTGTTLHLINDDLAAGMRHTFTSCLSPCDGQYVANYPLPDGRFDSGKLGNLDPIDGGLFTGSDTLPNRDLLIDNTYNVGQIYNYFCSIHPTMRGAFKVVA